MIQQKPCANCGRNFDWDLLDEDGHCRSCTVESIPTAHPLTGYRKRLADLLDELADDESINSDTYDLIEPHMRQAEQTMDDMIAIDTTPA